MAQQHDWNKVKTEYITTGISFRALAKKMKVSLSAINRHAQEEKWREQREQYEHKVTQKVIQKTQDKTIVNLSRFDQITERLLDKLEKAVDECDVVVVEDIKKVKKVDFDEDSEGNKVPIVIETTTKSKRKQKVCIDKSGLKQISSALKDIKDIRNLKSKIDEEEQRMRIAVLKRQAEGDQVDTDIVVTFGDDIEKFKV